jgi:catechol 2,3-dioxygenase-like lactoylglutathione lyase family enzyme
MRLVAFLATTDLERSHAFYGGVLGLRRVEASAYANAYDAAGTPLRVTRVERVAPAPYTVLGWEVEDVAAALAGHALEPLRYDGVDQDEHGVWTAPSGTRVAWFADPDGNTLSFSQAPRDG